LSGTEMWYVSELAGSCASCKWCHFNNSFFKIKSKGTLQAAACCSKSSAREAVLGSRCRSWDSIARHNLWL